MSFNRDDFFITLKYLYYDYYITCFLLHTIFEELIQFQTQRNYTYMQLKHQFTKNLRISNEKRKSERLLLQNSINIFNRTVV